MHGPQGALKSLLYLFLRSRMKYRCFVRNTTDQAFVQHKLDQAIDKTRSHWNFMVGTYHQENVLYFLPRYMFVCGVACTDLNSIFNAPVVEK